MTINDIFLYNPYLQHQRDDHLISLQLINVFLFTNHHPHNKYSFPFLIIHDHLFKVPMSFIDELYTKSYPAY